jgi:hypothetical protein
MGFGGPRGGGFGAHGFGGAGPATGFGGGLAPPGGGGFGAAPGRGFGGRPGSVGGLLDAGTPSAALVTLLQTGASGCRWAAATVGANSAAGVQLASGEPIMAIGGFNGTDPTPTLAQFKALVAAGQIHYFLGSGGGGGFGRGSDSSIATCVARHFTAQTAGGVTVYDLTEQ